MRRDVFHRTSDIYRSYSILHEANRLRTKLIKLSYTSYSLIRCKPCCTEHWRFETDIWEERVHAGNTTHIADSHPNRTKPRYRNKMNIQLSQKHRRLTETLNKRLLRGKMGVPPCNGQQQMPLGVKPGLRALNLIIIPSVPYKTNSVNKNNPIC